MAQYHYGETLTISTDNIAFNGTMPEESDITLGDSYYQNTYTEMVSPTNPRDKYIAGTSRVIWASGFPSPSAPEYDITQGRRAMWLTTVTGYPNKYYPVNYDVYIDWEEEGVWKYSGCPQVSFTLAWAYGTEPNSLAVGSGSTSYPITEVFFESNIPIFETKEEARAYIIGESDGTNAINYVGESPETPDGQYFEFSIQWTTSTWVNDNQPTVTGQPYFQGLRGKITDGYFGLYKIDGIDDNKLKYGIKSNATFYELEYSTDGRTWTETDELPWDFIYRRRVNELGTFSYALSFNNTDIPIWKDEQDAEDYIAGNKYIEDAENWDTISNQYPPRNPTGDPDDATTMGQVYTRAFFSQQYICGINSLTEIANALFDTSAGGVWEDIKKGLDMYGDSPVDDIQGCMFFPVDLNSVFTNTSAQNYIYFGGYKLDLQNNVNKIIFPNGAYDFGTFDIKPSFAYSYRDYAPYSRLFCYLAYIGWVELDIARYIGKTANIKYYIDTRTGGCLACIFANGVLTDYFNGQMGVSMPITATDYVAYANAQIQTLLTGASGVKGNAGAMFSSGQNMVNAGISAGAVAGAMLPVATAMAGMQGAKTLYGLTQNNINNFNKTMGSSSSMLNQYLPQYCMMMWEIQDGQETPNEKALQGYPSNASNIIGAFSGYLEVDAVNLVCGIATDNERAEIIQYLKSGVII